MRRLAACQSPADGRCLPSCTLVPLLCCLAKLVSSLHPLWHDPQSHHPWLYQHQLHKEISLGREASAQYVCTAFGLSRSYS